MENINLVNFVNDEMKQIGEYKIIKLKETFLCVYKNGEIYRWYDNNGRKIKNPKFKLIPNVDNDNGYNQIGINGKKILRHRIISFAFKNLDIDNEKAIVDHIDHNKMNNSIENLRIVTHQQNDFNRSNTKGYSFNKRYNKWQAKICLNGKSYSLGYYITEEDARKAYLNGKMIYHVIELDHAQQELNELENLEAEFQRIVNI